MRSNRAPGKLGFKTTPLKYSGRRPNQYMQGFLVRAVPRAGESDQTPAVNHRSQSRPPAFCASRSVASGARGEFCRRRERTADATADRARCTQHLAVLAYASACTTARQRAASRQPLRAIHRELESSRPIGGVARRWRRRPILAPAFSLCWVAHAIRLPVRLPVLADAFACTTAQ